MIVLTAVLLAAAGLWTETSFDECLTALGGQISRSPLLAKTGHEFGKSGMKDAQLRWNVNRPRKDGQINLLVPAGEVKTVPAACRSMPRFTPLCWSYPALREVVCNPAMGRFLESKAFSPTSSGEVQAGAHYFVDLVLGHELGHILRQPGRRARSHWMVETDGGILSCAPPSLQIAPEEAAADDIGATLACAATRHASISKPLRMVDLQSDVNVVKTMQDMFDQYFRADTLCLANNEYESMASRVLSFTEKFVECFDTKRQRPAWLLAHADREELRAAELKLSALQEQGWAATSKFGIARTAYQRVYAFGDSFFDLQQAADFTLFDKMSVGDDGIPIYAGLDGLRSHASVLRSRKEGDTLRLDLDARGSNAQLLSLDVRCSAGHCSAEAGAPTVWLGDGQLSMAQDGTIFRASPSSMALYTDTEALAAGKALVQATLEFAKAPAPRAVRDRLLAVAFDLAENGLYHADLFRNGAFESRFLNLAETDEHLLVDAMAFAGDRVLLVMVKKVTAGKLQSLWSCPDRLFDANPGETSCTVWRAPEELESPLAVLTRDLADLEDTRLELNPSGCGDSVAVTWLGWTWLLRTATSESFLLPAHGVVRCQKSEDGESAVTFRAGRIDVLRLPGGQQARKSSRTIVPFH